MTLHGIDEAKAKAKLDGACTVCGHAVAHADQAFADEVRGHLFKERMVETCEPEEALFSLVRYFGQRQICGVTKARGSTRAIELHRGEARCSIVAQPRDEIFALVIRPGGVT